ncbi:hypothetical protein DIURU_003984 [Diutina rugosa]|uniref:arginyltransferase n=1 Tax=Diutina rugosa TaxID=5481 RepID=A0A642UNN7_DIURU|nr:uncharacterized protein DIURU_003984 [Diutina rugosa]KAA8900168.1 hypothetical protein DIURU_003984 [Diutina rugosa]
MVATLNPPYYLSGKECGYCKCDKPDWHAVASFQSSDRRCHSTTLGTTVHAMSPHDYDHFINHGWRRSGTFLYKPNLLDNCCRLYTIRTRLADYRPTKHHRKVVNRFIREISGADAKPAKGPFDVYRLLEAEKTSTRFRVEYEPSAFTKEKYQLYRKYQVSVHNDDPADVDEKQFERFLCRHPFASVPDVNEVQGWPQRWSRQVPKNTTAYRGPIHECWYLDERLIAVSVLDVLPSGLSSIYFIWDPDYAHLSLGTLSGVRDILMTHAWGFDYYYLGYYIQDCVKMKYKGDFGGELLDVANNVYVAKTRVDEFIDHGRLFVLGETGQTTEPQWREGFPIPFAESSLSEKTDGEAINVADAVYGTASDTTSVAQSHFDYIRRHYGIKSVALMDHPQIKPLPVVMPGVVPMAQMRAWLEKDDLSDSTVIKVNIQGHTTEIEYGDLTAAFRGIVFDMVRVFGLEPFQKGDIIIDI